MIFIHYIIGHNEDWVNRALKLEYHHILHSIGSSNKYRVMVGRWHMNNFVVANHSASAFSFLDDNFRVVNSVKNIQNTLRCNRMVVDNYTVRGVRVAVFLCQPRFLRLHDNRSIRDVHASIPHSRQKGFWCCR